MGLTFLNRQSMGRANHMFAPLVAVPDWEEGVNVQEPAV